ncbi:MAG: hypothetical protein J6D13_05310, partial [Clostridium sp.]|nr:hypothetical protein [Clostridium sp.]
MRNLEHLMKMWKGKGKLVGVGLLLAVAVGLSVQGCGSKTTVTESETTVEASVETTQAELPVNEEEEELLSKLYRAISEADYAETAKVLNENEEAFESLMAGSLSGEKYCYREIEDENGQTICEMEPMGSSDEVEGMVVTRFNTVFYGTFSDGKPNGECRAVQAMILDQPRYSYAEGIWKDGKMNGEGKTGYHYYLNAPEAGFVRTDKEGNYLNNLL